MRKALMLFFVLLNINAVEAQSVVEYKKKCKKAAHKYIQELKEGTLVVRLKTRSKQQEFLRKQGKKESAREIEIVQDAYNKQIILAFSQHYSFSKYVFIWDQNTKAIVMGHATDETFMNADKQPIPLSEIVLDKLFYVDLGRVAQDTMAFAGKQYIDQGDTLSKVTEYNGGPNLGINALIMRNDKMQQIASPFPYYSKARLTGNRFPKMIARSVRRLNAKLFSFYKLNQNNTSD